MAAMTRHVCLWSR